MKLVDLPNLPNLAPRPDDLPEVAEMRAGFARLIARGDKVLQTWKLASPDWKRASAISNAAARAQCLYLSERHCTLRWLFYGVPPITHEIPDSRSHNRNQQTHHQFAIPPQGVVVAVCASASEDKTTRRMKPARVVSEAWRILPPLSVSEVGLQEWPYLTTFTNGLGSKSTGRGPDC